MCFVTRHDLAVILLGNLQDNLTLAVAGNAQTAVGETI